MHASLATTATHSTLGAILFLVFFVAFVGIPAILMPRFIPATSEEN